jgi:hypothetical protein
MSQRYWREIQSSGVSPTADAVIVARGLLL